MKKIFRFIYNPFTGYTYTSKYYYSQGLPIQGFVIHKTYTLFGLTGYSFVTRCFDVADLNREKAARGITFVKG